MPHQKPPFFKFIGLEFLWGVINDKTEFVLDGLTNTFSVRLRLS